jgi:hypothetical protein
VIGVYDIEKLVHVAISLLEPRGVEVLVRDDSAGADAQFLHFYASRLEPRAAATAGGLMPAGDEDQPRMVVSIPVGDRNGRSLASPPIPSVVQKRLPRRIGRCCSAASCLPPCSASTWCAVGANWTIEFS